MNETRMLVLATLALLAPACGGVPVAVGADLEPGLDFAQYTSYMWGTPDARPETAARLDDNPLLAQRLQAAINWELVSRGIHYRAPGPALAVHYHATVRDRVEVIDVARAEGYTTEYGLVPQTVEYREGNFHVDIVDARTGEITWRGWARLDLGDMNHPSVIGEDIDEAIRSMFERFPVPYREISVPEGR